jgi:predicted nucleic acid-binding protein
VAREIFVDTGAWLALADSRDPYYRAASTVYPRVKRRWPQLVTTNLVAIESYNLIRQRSSHATAMRFLLTVRNTARLLKVYADADLEAAAEEILRRYADQDFSYTDAVSFALMRQRGIAAAFTFDHHFLIAGFVLVPPIPR